MNFLKDFLPHFSISMLLGLVVLIYVDMRNPLMNFLTSTPSKIYLLILCAAGLATAILYITDRRRRYRRRPR